jgi:hypothetical protein
MGIRARFFFKREPPQTYNHNTNHNRGNRSLVISEEEDQKGQIEVEVEFEAPHTRNHISDCFCLCQRSTRRRPARPAGMHARYQSPRRRRLSAPMPVASSGQQWPATASSSGPAVSSRSKPAGGASSGARNHSQQDRGLQQPARTNRRAENGKCANAREDPFGAVSCV